MNERMGHIDCSVSVRYSRVPRACASATLTASPSSGDGSRYPSVIQGDTAGAQPASAGCDRVGVPASGPGQCPGVPATRSPHTLPAIPIAPVLGLTRPSNRDRRCTPDRCTPDHLPMRGADDGFPTPPH